MTAVSTPGPSAAHAGLIGAAIDGSLDSDANAWHLPSFAENNLNSVMA